MNVHPFTPLDTAEGRISVPGPYPTLNPGLIPRGRGLERSETAQGAILGAVRYPNSPPPQRPLLAHPIRPFSALIRRFCFDLRGFRPFSAYPGLSPAYSLRRRPDPAFQVRPLSWFRDNGSGPPEIIGEVHNSARNLAEFRKSKTRFFPPALHRTRWTGSG